MTNQKYGVSALGLQRLLGLGSYRTAWTMLRKLREAMVRPGRGRLQGTVEVDETYVGGIERGTRGRGTKCKNLSVNSDELGTRRQIAGSRGCKLGEDTVQDGTDQIVLLPNTR